MENNNENYTLHRSFTINQFNEIIMPKDTQSVVLDDTEIQMSMWFIFYQLNYIETNGLAYDHFDFTIDFFNEWLNVQRIHEYKVKTVTQEDGDAKIFRQSIGVLVYGKIKHLLPDGIRNHLQDMLNKNLTIKEFLDAFENTMISKNVFTIPFGLFVKQCKQFVPLDSAKIMISKLVDKANSKDKQSLEECAMNYFYGLHSFPINYQESFKYYEILAKDFNDAKSAMWLGIMYSKGIGVNQNYFEALEWFRKSSEMNYIEGKLNYALFLEYYNRKLTNNKQKVFHYIDYLKECVQAKHPKSLFQMGKLKESYPSTFYGKEQSIQYYLAAAEFGHIESARRLYHVFKCLGKTDEQNGILLFLVTINEPKYIYAQAQNYFNAKEYDASFKLIEAFLNTKYPKLLKLYGDHLLFGKVQHRNENDALENYIAACKDYLEAGKALAAYYIEKQSIQTAKEILLLATEQAKVKIRPLYKKEYAAFCEKQQLYKEAFTAYYELATEHLDKESQYHTGMSLLNPEHKQCKKNKKKGLLFLLRSASQHYPKAAMELGRAFIKAAYGIKPDFEQGIRYLKLARSLNVPEAGFLLGKIYLNGIGTIPDLKLSRAYFKGIIEQHSSNADAFELVAKAHYYLWLLSFDETEREQYLQKAANLSYAKAQFIYGMRLLEQQSSTDWYHTGKHFIITAASQNYAPAKKQIEKMGKLQHKTNH